MRQILYISLLLFMLSACAKKSTETLFFDQVTYTEKSSFLTRKKYPYNRDETAREPRRTSTKMTLIKDATTKFTFTVKERLKKHSKYGEFYIQKVKFDTTKVELKTNLKYTDLSIVGGFNPSENSISISNYYDKGIIFQNDGSCIQTYNTSSNESGTSTSYKRLGEYKVLNDTLYIVYFLGKNYSKQYRVMNSSVKSIDDLSWNIIKPYSVDYVLTSTNDTLRKISKDRFSNYLIATDSLKLQAKPERD